MRKKVKNEKGWEIKLGGGLIYTVKKYGRKTASSKNYNELKFHMINEDERYQKRLIKKRIQRFL